MTNEEIIKGLDLACSSITGSFMWTVNPFPILRDYIHRLQSENAALRERLERSVELPCKVGDTVYLLLQTSHCPAGEIEDLQKAAWYLNREIMRLEKSKEGEK